MHGIHFVMDEEGNKVAVQIDLEEHSELWEDIYDVLTAEARAQEPRASLKAVKQSLRKQRGPRG